MIFSQLLLKVLGQVQYLHSTLLASTRTVHTVVATTAVVEKVSTVQ